jgi:DNA-binding protein H-NS
MAVPNIDDLSVDELKQLISNAKNRIEDLHKQVRKVAIERAKAALAEAGLTLEEAAAALGGRASRGSAAASRKGKDPSKARYFHPDTGEWSSGVGRLPASLKAAKDEGRLDQYALSDERRDELIREGRLG